MVSTGLLLSLNKLFLSLVTSSHVPCPPPPSKGHKRHHHPKHSPSLAEATCPINIHKLGICGNLLGNLMHRVIGTPSKNPCCSLIHRIADRVAARCLCNAMKVNLLGINLDMPCCLSLLLNSCGKHVPSGFQCA